MSAYAGEFEGFKVEGIFGGVKVRKWEGVKVRR
jgi:hypothetical protein